MIRCDCYGNRDTVSRINYIRERRQSIFNRTKLGSFGLHAP